MMNDAVRDPNLLKKMDDQAIADRIEAAHTEVAGIAEATGTPEVADTPEATDASTKPNASRTLPIHQPETFGPASQQGQAGTLTFFPALELAPEPVDGPGRPAIKRIFTGAGANLILATFQKGQELNDHKAIHPITVQCLTGAIDFGYDGKVYTLTPGSILHLDANVVHRVDCSHDEPSVMLLTMLT